MQLARYITYKDVKGIDVSYSESIFYIKLLFGKYNRNLILEFLGYVSKEIGFENNPQASKKLQNEFGIDINGFLIHTRSILVLFQVFYETKKFNEDYLQSQVDNNDIFLLFLYANQILTKTDSPFEKNSNSVVTIGHLISTMRMYIGSIIPFEVGLIHEIFLNFYNTLIDTDKYSEYNEIIIKHTGISISRFIEILISFKKQKTPADIFRIYDKFAVLNYDKIYYQWENRNPKIKLPLDYRFIEQLPLIKKDNQYYAPSMIMLFIGFIRKIYHVLSFDENSKQNFRGFWGANVVEPVIKNLLMRTFENDEVKINLTNTQKIIGVELSDAMIINNDDIYLIEIKSGYMALNNRYSDNPSEFKKNFEEKYVFNDSNKHQLINQLDIFHDNYDKIVDIFGLNKETNYKVFSVSLVFDEALSMMGFKRYLGKTFNDYIMPKMSGYSKFTPYIYSNLLTFAELLAFERRIPDINKRMMIFKSLFNYQDSFWDLIDDIKGGKIKIDEINKEDIK